MTPDGFAREAKMIHGVDDDTLGAVHTGNVYITPTSFTANSITPNIQRAVQTAVSGDTIYIAAGNYKGAGG